jgi:hypothetical protein
MFKKLYSVVQFETLNVNFSNFFWKFFEFFRKNTLKKICRNIRNFFGNFSNLFRMKILKKKMSKIFGIFFWKFFEFILNENHEKNFWKFF